MEWPECQIELPEGSRFCDEFGKTLEVVCQGGGKANPPASKFRLVYGRDLRTPTETALPKDLSFDEQLAKIHKYLPEGLTEKVLSQRARIEDERRRVTVMFVDCYARLSNAM